MEFVRMEYYNYNSLNCNLRLWLIGENGYVFSSTIKNNLLDPSLAQKHVIIIASLSGTKIRF